MFHYNTKQKRFSVMGWILKKCCGVATQDEFDSLYKSEDLLASHMELIKGTVHADHRSMTEIAAKSDDMTKEFNGVLDKARNALNEMMNELNIEEQDEIIIKHLLSLYKITNKLALKMRKNIASSSCQNKRIPATIISPNLLQTDLANLTNKLSIKEWELAIQSNMFGKYYGFPIASCVRSTNTILIRVKIPIIRANKGRKGVNVKAIPVADFNSTCEFILTSQRANKYPVSQDSERTTTTTTGKAAVAKSSSMITTRKRMPTHLVIGPHAQGCGINKIRIFSIYEYLSIFPTSKDLI
uniref:Uncharacterized protein n=3 Tax=Cacopsylla melanoneura TaxID=428564 RepID=A0A8D8PTW4_9HEMI